MDPRHYPVVTVLPARVMMAARFSGTMLAVVMPISVPSVVWPEGREPERLTIGSMRLSSICARALPEIFRRIDHRRFGGDDAIEEGAHGRQRFGVELRPHHVAVHPDVLFRIRHSPAGHFRRAFLLHVEHFPQFTLGLRRVVGRRRRQDVVKSTCCAVVNGWASSAACAWSAVRALVVNKHSAKTDFCNDFIGSCPGVKVKGEQSVLWRGL
ncbi:hypothetical protein J4732_15785 [Serratia marcescens]|uniref:Uncharacterized protein n=1 Tax=Serratia marcescens TaxID=615 RepID=A0A939SUT2_SERMA|nr:hypothetical protein [Serratia marcescens]